MKAARAAILGVRKMGTAKAAAKGKELREASVAEATEAKASSAGLLSAAPAAGASAAASAPDAGLSLGGGASPPALPRVDLAALAPERLTMARLLSRPITKHAGAAASPEATLQAGGRLEAALFRALGLGRVAGQPSYTDQVKTFVLNMNRNRSLALGVLSGSADLDALAVADTAELATEEFKREVAKEKKAAAEEVQLDWERKNRDKMLASAGLKKTEGQFRCGKCKSKNTTHTEYQTRGGDEPMTVFVHCNDCGGRMRF